MLELNAKIQDLENYAANLAPPIQMFPIIKNSVDGWCIFESSDLFVGYIVCSTPNIDIYHSIEYPVDIHYEPLMTTVKKIKTWISREEYFYYIIHNKNSNTYIIYKEIYE